MGERTLDTHKVEDAHDLQDGVEYLLGLDVVEGLVYVRDQHGNPVTSVSVVEDTLTDGSKVYNLVVHVSH